MSNPSEPSDSSKPVVKDKDPHNYRKVGYSMIVISVSLVLIGLLVWAIGDNWHFSTDIMAGQETDAMTPKSGYNLVVFDYTQPVGAKLKFLDHANDVDNAKKLQTQYAQQYLDQKGQVLIFDDFHENNTNSIALAEIYAMTPSTGYHVIAFNTALPVGAKLSSLKQDTVLANATKDSQMAQDGIKDPQIHVIIMTSSFDDNLQQVLGSKYSKDFVSKNYNKFKISPPVVEERQTMSTMTEKPAINVNATGQVMHANQTKVIVQNATSPTKSTNTTAISGTNVSNKTKTALVSSNAGKLQINANVTSHISNQTKITTANGTISTEKLGVSANVTAPVSKVVSLSEKIGINSTSK